MPRGLLIRWPLRPTRTSEGQRHRSSAICAASPPRRRGDGRVPRRTGTAASPSESACRAALRSTCPAAPADIHERRQSGCRPRLPTPRSGAAFQRRRASGAGEDERSAVGAFRQWVALIGERSCLGEAQAVGCWSGGPARCGAPRRARFAVRGRERVAIAVSHRRSTMLPRCSSAQATRRRAAAGGRCRQNTSSLFVVALWTPCKGAAALDMRPGYTNSVLSSTRRAVAARATGSRAAVGDPGRGTAPTPTDCRGARSSAGCAATHGRVACASQAVFAATRRRGSERRRSAACSAPAFVDLAGARSIT